MRIRGGSYDRNVAIGRALSRGGHDVPRRRARERALTPPADRHDDARDGERHAAHGLRAQTAPLAIAVIGGLLASLVGTLFAVPSAFTILTSGVAARSPSIDPDDPGSRHFEQNPRGESNAA